MSFSVYIHIPYCFHKCPYCDFNTYAVSNIPEKEYVQALLSELDYLCTRDEWRGREVKTIFFGGGTPSLFTSGSIQKIISTLGRTFPLSDKIEISLEANPGTTSGDNLAGYREAGVNRISFGAQSFKIETLKKLGRMHTPDQVISSVEAARVAGFNNVNLDIIYGVEEQSLSDLISDLKQALELYPEHISAYGLTIEKGTPFFQRYKKGQMKLPPEDLILEMMQVIKTTLNQNEFTHYEISNYSRANKEARHNLAYWDGDDYMGIGAGAHSFCLLKNGKISGKRWSNYALPEKYMKTANAAGCTSSWTDVVSLENLIFEFFFLGLRKIKGVSKVEFKNKFGLNLDELYPITLQMLSEQGLIINETDNIQLSENGIFLADSVIESFVDVEQKL
jgi:oxygen-independent coproporphyrinogen-3 oxidase